MSRGRLDYTELRLTVRHGEIVEMRRYLDGSIEAWKVGYVLPDWHFEAIEQRMAPIWDGPDSAEECAA